MNTKIFSIYDEASQAYMMPFFSPQNASAIRAVVTQLKDPNSMLAQHPEDFTLYAIGHYDDQLGVLSTMIPTELVGKLIDYLDLSIGGTRSALSHPSLSDGNDANREQPNLHGNNS